MSEAIELKDYYDQQVAHEQALNAGGEPIPELLAHPATILNHFADWSPEALKMLTLDIINVCYLRSPHMLKEVMTLFRQEMELSDLLSGLLGFAIIGGAEDGSSDRPA